MLGPLARAVRAGPRSVVNAIAVPDLGHGCLRMDYVRAMLWRERLRDMALLTGLLGACQPTPAGPIRPVASTARPSPTLPTAGSPDPHEPMDVGMTILAIPIALSSLRGAEAEGAVARFHAVNGQTGDAVVVGVEGGQISLAPGQDAVRIVRCADVRIRLLFEPGGTWSLAPWEGPARHRFDRGDAFELRCAGAQALVGWREDQVTRVAAIGDSGIATSVAIASLSPAHWSGTDDGGVAVATSVEGRARLQLQAHGKLVAEHTSDAFASDLRVESAGPRVVTSAHEDGKVVVRSWLREGLRPEARLDIMPSSAARHVGAVQLWVAAHGWVAVAVTESWLGDRTIPHHGGFEQANELAERLWLWEPATGRRSKPVDLPAPASGAGVWTSAGFVHLSVLGSGTAEARRMTP